MGGLPVRMVWGWVGCSLAMTTVAMGAPQLAGQAKPDAVVQAGRARFTVLTPTLLRLEYAPDGAFEDRPSLFAVRRDLPVPQFSQRESGQWLEIETSHLRLSYHTEGDPFDEDNLLIELIGGAKDVEWRPGTPNTGNLGGTVRTLDQCRGPIDLGQGLLSRDGWYLLDDSGTVVLEGEQNPWPTVREDGKRIDWYFFGYGPEYTRALSDLIAVGGPIPLPPRFTFGSWYSRYWPYTTADFLEIADGYRDKGYPLDVMVIDIDWHLAGWTGYTWNGELIPEPEKLLSELHDRGLHVALNLHPNEGVGAHEAAYPEFARAMGMDPAGEQPIPFDIADPRYVENYFNLLHHPLEAQGVDFWWVDWQQERTTKIAGLDPLPWLSHLHFYDRAREGTGRRGLTFSRWGGWGCHRYPIQFSGDTESTWKVLEFLVPFTSTAGNVGAAYWSHDLGGHWSSGGQIGPELYARWLQFGAFSAAMRVHSTRDPDNDRRPWLYGDPFQPVARAAYDLRYRLIPYIYTMARKTYETGLPLVRPMYLHHPQDEMAYEVPGQYYFGDDMIVAPVVEPGRGLPNIADVEVWLPQGEWYDLLTNARYQGPTETLIKSRITHVPAFVRGGRPIPMQPGGKLNTKGPIDPLVIRVYPGPSGETVLYEDDGESADYAEPEGFAKTRITYTPGEQAGAFELIIHPIEGRYRGMPEARTVVLEACWSDAAEVTVDGEAIPQGGPAGTAPSWEYVEVSTLTASVRLPERRLDQPTTIRFAPRQRSGAARQPSHEMHQLGLAERDWQVQLGLTNVKGLAQAHLTQFLNRYSGQERWERVAEWGEAVVLDRLAHGAQFPATVGRAAESLLNAALRFEFQSADRNQARVAGRVWLTRLPASGSVTGTISLAPLEEDMSPFATAPIVFEKPGKQPFAFDLPIDPQRLDDFSARLVAEFEWAGAPVRFAHRFVWPNSYVGKWWVTGPFAGGKGPTAGTLEPETKPDLDARYVGLGGKEVVWQPVEVGQGDPDGAMVDFLKLFGGENRTAFAQAFLDSGADANVEFVMQHDDGAIVQVNGEVVYSHDEPRALQADPVTFPVKLKQGRNHVLVKLDQLGGTWAFNVRVQPRGGESLPEIRMVENSSEPGA
ncbi:MAG TPA: TIM-barrel domain-containing protein [Phycisphaerae bacterium]|nr:TIM-barrel domain-containing protein [Phycisphaerae bacterium]